MRAFLNGLCGNDEQRERLGRAIERERLSHAFLLFGPKGSGRHTLALEVAAALNCERRTDRTEPLPCRRCSRCRRILSGQFPDLHVLSRADKSVIGVDEVRLIREDMFLSATEADVKVYIVEDAHTLTLQAQNALLKVLEEPPTRSVLFLLTEALDPILTTVKSRAQCIRMERLDEATVRAHLVKHVREAGLSVRDEELAAAVRGADGILGVALARIEPSSLEAERRLRGTVDSLLKALTEPSFAPVHEAVGALGQKRADATEVAARLTDALRDLLVLKKDEQAPLLYFLHRSEAYAISEAFTVRRLCAVIGAVREAVDRIAGNANMTLTLATLAADLNKKV